MGLHPNRTGDPSLCWAVQLLMVFPSRLILFIYQVIRNVCVLAHFLWRPLGRHYRTGGLYFHKRLSHSDYGIILGLKIVVLLPLMTTRPYTAVRAVYRKGVARSSVYISSLLIESFEKSIYMRSCRPPHHHHSIAQERRKKKKKNDKKYFLILYFLRRKRGISTGWRTRLFVVAVGFYRWDAAKFLFHFFRCPSRHCHIDLCIVYTNTYIIIIIIIIFIRRRRRRSLVAAAAAYGDE